MITMNDNIQTISSSWLSFFSLCSNSKEGSPMNLPFTSFACSILSSVAGGNNPHCIQFLLCNRINRYITLLLTIIILV